MLRVRVSLNNLKMDDDVLSISLFLADRLNRLIGRRWNREKDKNRFLRGNRPNTFPFANL